MVGRRRSLDCNATHGWLPATAAYLIHLPYRCHASRTRAPYASSSASSASRRCCTEKVEVKTSGRPIARIRSALATVSAAISAGKGRAALVVVVVGGGGRAA